MKIAASLIALGVAAILGRNPNNASLYVESQD